MHKPCLRTGTCRNALPHFIHLSIEEEQAEMDVRRPDLKEKMKNKGGGRIQTKVEESRRKKEEKREKKEEEGRIRRQRGEVFQKET